MKLIIHGEDTVSSRNLLKEKLDSLKESEKIVFDGNKITLSDIVTIIDSPSLFAGTKVVVVENFFARALSKEKISIMDFLNQNKNNHILIFWEEREVDKTVLSKYFLKEEIRSFQPPLLLFKFLDSLGSSPAQSLLTIYRTLVKNRDAMFIYTMLLRQLRLLIIAKDSGPGGMGNIAPWQAKKFHDQSRFFDLNDLIAKYRGLLALEYNFKSGRTPFSFEELLDIYLVSL